MISILLNYRTWLPEVFSNKHFFARDLVAGITIATILIPQSMAYASLAGVDPVYGLYASFIPVATAAFFGSSRYLATGPVAMVSILTAVAAGSLAGEQKELYIYFAVLLSFSVGITQIILSFIKAGKFFDRIPRNVIVGFTSAAAFIIAITQLHKVFGVIKMNLNDLVNLDIFLSNISFNQFAVLISIMAATIIFFMKYKSQNTFINNFSILTAVVISIFVSIIFTYNGPVVGFIPDGLPTLALPSFNNLSMSYPMFITHTLIITFVGFMEAFAVSQRLSIKMAVRESQDSIDNKPYYFNVNQELFGQGVSNITSGLSNSYPVSGSFSRSSVSVTANGFSGFTSIVTTIVVGLVLVFATETLFSLPEATLGVIIIFAVIPLIEIRRMMEILKDNLKDGFVTWATFFSTLLFAAFQIEIYEDVNTHIWTGIIFGFMLSLILNKIYKN